MTAHPADGDAQRYEISVAGRLAPRWSAWFDGLSITARTDGTTLLDGTLADQAALHGVLQRLRDLGIPLLAVTRVTDATPTTNTTTERPDHDHD